MKPVADRVAFFDASFDCGGMSDSEMVTKCNETIKPLAREAGERAKELLIERGYFNGNIESNVFHHQSLGTINVQVVLTCYGLPQFNEPKA